MNTYNIFEKENSSTILFHAIAENESQIKNLAEQKGFEIEGMTIELERSNIKTEMGKLYQPSITDTLIY